MDRPAIPFIIFSCRGDIEFIHDTLFQTTLSNYNNPDNMQYMFALNKLDIDGIISRLKELKMKRNLLNSLITNTTSFISRSDSNSTIHNVQSSGSLFFPMDDLL